MSRAEFHRRQREAFLAHLRSDCPPTPGSPEQLRRWAREQAAHGRREQAIAQELGWTVNDVRRAISERPVA